MFEHFGFFDVVLGLWKYKIRIIVVSVCACLAMIAAAWRMNYNIDITEDVFLASKTYYVEFYSEDTLESEEKNAASTLNAVLDADFCKMHVTDYVIEKLGKDEVAKILEIDNPDDISYETIPTLIKHSILSDGNSVNIYVTTKNQAFANIIIEAYDSYAKSFEKDMKNIRFVNLGGIQQGYVIENEKHSYLKFGLIGGISGMGMSCIVVFVYLLLVPVLNRESDFEEYGLRVFGRM